MKTKIIMITITAVLIIGVIIITILTGDNKEFNIDDITHEEGVVNIYYFWGDGCPRCEEQNAFFERIEKEYGNYFKLYKFEVWKNESNAKLMTELADLMNLRISGVPFTIIGEDTFNGFGSHMEPNMINAILSNSQKDFDVIRDKIKN